MKQSWRCAFIGLLALSACGQRVMIGSLDSEAAPQHAALASADGGGGAGGDDLLAHGDAGPAGTLISFTWERTWPCDQGACHQEMQIDAACHVVWNDGETTRSADASKDPSRCAELAASLAEPAVVAALHSASSCEGANGQEVVHVVTTTGDVAKDIVACWEPFGHVRKVVFAFATNAWGYFDGGAHPNFGP